MSYMANKEVTWYIMETHGMSTLETQNTWTKDARQNRRF